MKFAATATAAAVLASGVSAQVSSPLTMLQYGSALLTANCRTTLTGLVNGSDFAKCLQVQNLLPILNNANSSVVPNVEDYLVDICAAEACSPEVIQNTTRSVLSSCSKDLSRFGISNATVETVMGAYDTARKVACLSTNSTELADGNSTVSTNMTSSMNMTSSNSTLCPIALLYQAEEYLGVNFTNTYTTSLLLGANATAYQQLLAVPQNGTIVDGLVCNDCVAAGLQVVLGDYPKLANLTFNVNSSTVEQYVNVTLSQNGTGPSNSTWNISSLYEGVCGADFNATGPFPTSINETAYNSTVSTNSTSTALPRTSTGVVGATSARLSATSAVASVTSSAAAAISSVVAPSAPAAITTAAGPVTSAIAPVVATVTSAVAPVVAPTKRWMKWD